MNTDDLPPRRSKNARPSTGPAAASCELALQNPCRYPEAGARRIRPWLEPVVSELAPTATSFTVRFVSDREMRRLNARYRGKDRPTDVLSFPGDLEPSEPSGLEPVSGHPGLDAECHLGDVVIAVPTARRQATAAGHAAARELRVLLLHGVLHCLGHDHETDDGTMERLEKRLRQRLVDGAEKR